MREQRQAPATRAARIARRGVGALILGLLIPALAGAPGWAAGGGSAASGTASASRVSDQAGARSAARGRETRRAGERRRLMRALRRDPRRALRGDFLRRAAVSGFKMPVTVRLRTACDPAQNPTGSGSPGGALLTTENCAAQGTALNERDGTKLGVSWIPTGFPLNGALFPAPPGEQTLNLAGSFPMVIDFDAGAGYGGVGNIQARTGVGGSIRSAGPLVISEPAGCAGTPPPFVEAATTTGGTPIAASLLAPTWVDMNPFSGASRGYLDLKLSIRSRVLGTTTPCTPPVPPADYDVPVSTVATDPWNAAVRIRWEGGFRIAPAITKDGAIRFGKITVNDTSPPQGATSGNLWGCAAEAAITGAGLPLSTPCTSASAPPLGEPVGPAPYPATLIVKSLSADVLLGDRG